MCAGIRIDVGNHSSSNHAFGLILRKLRRLLVALRARYERARGAGACRIAADCRPKLVGPSDSGGRPELELAEERQMSAVRKVRNPYMADMGS